MTLLTLVATAAWGLVLAAIFVGRGIGVPKDGRRGFWFAVVLLLPVIGAIIYAIRAMPELPRLDRLAWISTIVVTAIVLLTASAIQEMKLTSCESRTDGDITLEFCTRQAPSIATAVGVSILAAAGTVIVVGRERLRRGR
jgi:hypothetical protein